MRPVLCCTLYGMAEEQHCVRGGSEIPTKEETMCLAMQKECNGHGILCWFVYACVDDGNWVLCWHGRQFGI